MSNKLSVVQYRLFFSENVNNNWKTGIFLVIMYKLVLCLFFFIIHTGSFMIANTYYIAAYVISKWETFFSTYINVECLNTFTIVCVSSCEVAVSTFIY